MRWIGLLLVLLAVPGFIAMLRSDPRYRRYAWIGIGLLPYAMGAWRLDVSFISWAYWPGYTKGALVSILDSLAIALIVVSPARRAKIPMLGLFITYLAFISLSLAFAEVKMATLFVAWQTLRVLIVFIAVVMACTDRRAPIYIITGLALGAMYQGFYALSERVLQGVTQAGGTLGHQNLLGMATHFALLPTLALLLAGRRNLVTIGGVLAGIVVIFLTGSRGTIGFGAAGVVVLTVLSTIQRPTARKYQVLGFGLVAMLATAPIGFSTLQARYEVGQAENSNEEREGFKRAAWAMWNDHPMGVGANQYVVVANSGHYSERAGVNWSSFGATVHNTYMLLLAETGILGVFSFMLLLAGGIFKSVQLTRAKPRDERNELALGVGVTLAVVAAHAAYEWIVVYAIIQYLLAIALGILAGIARQRAIEGKARRRTQQLVGPMRLQLPATTRPLNPALR